MLSRYTGSGAVGRIVASAAAKHLTPVTLEVRLKLLALLSLFTFLFLSFPPFPYTSLTFSPTESLPLFFPPFASTSLPLSWRMLAR